MITLFNHTSTAYYPTIMFSSIWQDGVNNDTFRAFGAGRLTQAQDTDAVRFLFESGNIASGSWALYGYT